MTAKRFTVDKDGRTILDNIDDSYCECVDGYEAKQYCGKLNELYEERNYFERKKCEYWNEFNLAHLDNINLRKENEQLKNLIKTLIKEVEKRRIMVTISDEYKEVLE